MTLAQREHEFAVAKSDRKHDLEVLDKQILLETAKKASAVKPHSVNINPRTLYAEDGSEDEDAKASDDEDANTSDYQDAKASDDETSDDGDGIDAGVKPGSPTISLDSDSEDDEEVHDSGFRVGDKVKWTKTVKYTTGIVRKNKKTFRVAYLNPWTDQREEKTVPLKGNYLPGQVCQVKFSRSGIVTGLGDDEIEIDLCLGGDDGDIETYAGKAEWPEIEKTS